MVVVRVGRFYGEQRSLPGGVGGPPPAARCRWGRRRRGGLVGGVESRDVALELGPGDPTTARDVHRPQVAGLDQLVDGGSADAEYAAGLDGGEQQLLVGEFGVVL